MKVRFLEIDEEETFLLGYPLKLTPTERRFLLFIAQNEFASADDLIPLLRTDASRGNIAVHICEINKIYRINDDQSEQLVYRTEVRGSPPNTRG